MTSRVGVATLYALMLRRLFIGLVLGLVVGALLAAGLVLGLKMVVFETAAGIAFAYLAAALTGVLTGLVAGKPIWASNAKIEAGLKAVVGGVLGAGVLFALRQWAGAMTLDLGVYGAGGPAPIGSLPAVSLPIIAATLGALFELDNTGDPEETKLPDRKRVAPERANAALVSSRNDADDSASRPDTEVASKRAKR